MKKADHLETLLAHKFTRFLMQRAEHFVILRRRPVKVSAGGGIPGASKGHVSAQGFDVSFLVTNTHLEKMWKHKLIDFIVQFLQDVDKEISAMKIAVNARSRAVATALLASMA